MRDLNRSLDDAVGRMDDAAVADLRAGLVQAFAPDTRLNGAIVVPARTLVASATA
jgi:hypothetical protein